VQGKVDAFVSDLASDLSAEILAAAGD